MLSIYLAWSLYKLGVVLLLLGVVALFVTTTPSIRGLLKLKHWLGMLGFALVVIFASAFNIGDRQQALNRSAFNAEPPAAIEQTVQATQMTVEDVKQSFETAVKKTQIKGE